MSDDEPDLAESSADAQEVQVIDAWYGTCRPFFIDLVGDYAGRELFLLEGDSMLRECFSDDRIDFEIGFQMLHAVYVVERFLENMIKRHCRFQIVFFDEHAPLCVPSDVKELTRPRYLLARSIIVRHLELYLTKSTGVEVLSFDSVYGHVFAQHLVASPVHFVMAHDGFLHRGGTVDRNTKKYDVKARAMLRKAVFWFHIHRLNIALINQIEFRDSKVFTMILEGSSLSGIAPRWREAAQNLASKDCSGAKMLGSNSREWPHQEKLSGLLMNDSNVVSQGLLLLASSIALIAPREDDLFGSIMLLHKILLKHLSLSQRRLPSVKFSDEVELEIDQYQRAFAKAAIDLLARQEGVRLMVDHSAVDDLADLVDGRFFRVLLHASMEDSLVSALPASVKAEWDFVSDLVLGCPKEKIVKAHKDISFLVRKEEAYSIDTKSDLAVLPFSNPVFDKHLACIHVTTEVVLSKRLTSLKLYRETTHWHNRRPLKPKQLPAVKITKWKNPLRMNQFYMSEMKAYAASLTGAKGKILEPETITVGARVLPKTIATSTKVVASTAGNKKAALKTAPALSKKEQIIADNNKKRGNLESDKAFVAWKTIRDDLDLGLVYRERYSKARTYLNSLDPSKSAHIEAEVNLYILLSLLHWWSQLCESDTKPQGYYIAALIWTSVRATCSSKGLTKEIIKYVEQICRLLLIGDAMSDLDHSGPDHKLSFRPSLPRESKTLAIGLSQCEFQLMHVGPYMDRQLDAKPDPRVPSFTPDGWQSKVLDELDKNKSVFVVAPTSAGKTFISFYAMEQVLRRDDEGILVYVAPTKALVNQIAAEIQGRFSKKFSQAGKSVWAIHTRDHRINSPTGCQILVTVPHILQIMLLAPTNAKSWAAKVRRIIFDEIHCIGQAEDGVVWEQLLLLAPCPIIALSATVGNPAEFSEWLAETQKASKTELTMIQHSTRYSDLRKFFYTPPNTFKFEGFEKSVGVRLGLDDLPGFNYFHPVASLIDKSRGIPSDLALEPRDCFLLWKAMCKLQNDNHKVPAELNPAKALPSVIKKVDIFKWEKDLKKVLAQWMVSTRHDSPFDTVVQELSPKPKPPNNSVTNVTNDTSFNSPARDVGDRTEYLHTTTLPLLCQLHQRQALPAILFNYDRSGCEYLATALLKQLVDAEYQWKSGKEWRHKLDAWTKWKELKEKKAAKKPPKPSKKKSGDGDDEKASKADQVRDDASSEVSSFDLFDPDEPLDNFSFADKRKCQKFELDEFISQLRWKHIKEELIQLLQRGIGVHHSGMNRKYRQSVEMLFRKGYLRVVIATGTLSLGINMPCATVVFSGDSVFLTALNFRQAAGRAGRRGFDLLGNVVFHGITTERACRLLSSRLPDLSGHFPITTTLVLRLFSLLHGSNNAPYAEEAINSLLSQPRLYLGGESFKEQVLHHLRFSIDYLRRQDLLGPSGEPANFTSCVSHLYFTENSSFAFHALLKDGYFKTLCADIDTSTDQVLRTMMLVLSHLFGRRVCRKTDNVALAETIKTSSSMVYLPPMPEDAALLLRTHNANTLSIFTTYVKTFAEQHIKGEQSFLPLTNINVAALEKAELIHSDGQLKGRQNGKASGGMATSSSTMDFTFIPTLPAPRARSAFVALSGHGDSFKTITDLCTSARSGIFLESAVIPHVELYPDESKTPLNAYLLDFFVHGAVKPLEVANGIRRSDVWFVLNDFSLVLATITTSLANYLGLSTEDVNEEILETMGSGDAAENEGDEKLVVESDIADSMSTQPNVPTNASKGVGDKKSKGVAKNWDSGEESEFEEGDQSTSIVVESDDDEYKKLMKVYRAFKLLKIEFDGKFHKIWA